MLVVCTLCMLNACREEQPSNVDYKYSLNVQNENYTTYLVLDKVQGSVLQISETPNWLEVSADGEDANGHPKIRFDVLVSVDEEAQKADVDIALSTKQVVRVSVFQPVLADGFFDNGAAAPAFDKNTWRSAQEIAVYNPTTGSMRSVALPWADMAVTSMPESYLMPNEDPAWELTMNTCDKALMDGLHMFVLYNKLTAQIRFYTYLDQLPSATANSYYVTIKASGSKGLYDPDASPWIAPDGVTNQVISLPSSLPQMAEGVIVVAPNTADATGLLSSGWICYELDFKGLSKVKPTDRLSISMIGISTVNTSGSQVITGTMTGDNCTLVTPGNQAKACAMRWSTTGGLFSGISSSISGAIGSYQSGGALGAGFTGIFGGLGAIFSAIGGYKAANAEEQEQVQKLNLSFKVNQTGQITMVSTSTVGTTVKPITVKFSSLLGSLFENQKAAPARMPAASENAYQLGVWTVKQSPVIYIYEDALFREDKGNNYYLNDGNTFYQSDDADEGLRFVTFLDPTSLQLKLNTDERFYPYSQVDSIAAQVYDFAFVDNAYTYPVRPYYQAYGITVPQVTISSNAGAMGSMFWNDKMELIECAPSQMLIDVTKPVYTAGRTTSEETNTHDFIYRYGGSRAEEMPQSMKAYSILTSPIIYVPRSESGYFSTHAYLGHVGVAVVLYVYLHGEEEPVIFADRVLPQFKTFKKGDIASLKTQLQNGSHIQKTEDGKSVDYMFYNLQRDRAIRMLKIIQNN